MVMEKYNKDYILKKHQKFSQQSMVFACALLLLDLTPVMSDGVPSSSRQPIQGYRQSTVCGYICQSWLLLGSSLLLCPTGFLSAQSPRVDYLTSGSTACTTLMCLQRCFLLHSGKWDTLVSPGKCCSVYWENCG